MITNHELLGKQYGRLQIIDIIEQKGRTTFASTECSCGATRLFPLDQVVRGITKSCGCMAREVGELLRSQDDDGNLKYVANREYAAFKSAHQRCYNPKAHAFDTCGGRGVSMHEPWIGDFPAFYKDMGPARPGQILTRRNLGADFSPSNCYWGNWDERSAAQFPHRKQPQDQILNAPERETPQRK